MSADFRDGILVGFLLLMIIGWIGSYLSGMRAAAKQRANLDRRFTERKHFHSRGFGYPPMPRDPCPPPKAPPNPYERF